MKTIEEIAISKGLCNCNEGYKSRGLPDPSCPYHSFAVDEAMQESQTEVVKELIKRFRSQGNVFLEKKFKMIDEIALDLIKEIENR